MESTENEKFTGLTLDRLLALTDGIFAIAMTILVLAIDIPENSNGLSGLDLHKAILSQSNQLISYVTSFLLLALFWSINHRQAGCLIKTTSLHIWINIFMLIFICLVPYTTSLKSDFYNDWMANLYFNVNMLIIAVLYYVNWKYASHNHRLTKKDLPKQRIKNGENAGLIFILIGIIACIASFIIPENSSYVYVLIPVFKLVDSKMFNKKAKPVSTN